MENKEEKNYLESKGFIYLIIKWAKPLLIMSALAAVLSYIFSGPAFIKPLYKSSVIFFPSKTNSISQTLLNTSMMGRQDLLAFGEEEQAEQLLQILYSDEIRRRIVEKYDLMKHYDIDPSSEYPYTKLYDKMTDNIKFERTEFMSVKIEVMDTDAQMAADIANDISALLDSMKTKMERSRAFEGLKIVKAEYLSKAEQIKEMEDSLLKLRKHGIFDYEKQSEILTQELAKASSVYDDEMASLAIYEKVKNPTDTAVINTRARMNGAARRLKNIEHKLDMLALYGGANVSLTKQLELEREQLSVLKEKYEKAKVDAEQNLPHKFMVNNAAKSEKKSYPIRWLIVLISVLSTFLITFFVLVLLEKVSRVRHMTL